MGSRIATRALLLSWLASLGYACTDSLPQAEPAPFAVQLGALGECQPWATTVAGIAFSNAEATDTLAFVQKGTAAQLDAVTYIGPTLAAAIIGARPFATGPAGLQQLDAISGVGPTVLGALKAQTPTLWCPTAGCCKVAGTGTVTSASLVINEFSLGASGFLEVYNAGSASVDLSGYSIDDIANAGSAPKKFAAGTSIAPKGYAVLSYAGFNGASADSVRLLDSTGKEVDVHANGYQGQSLGGVCRGRAPDGGPMAPHNLTC